MAGWEELGGGTPGHGFRAKRITSDQTIATATYTTVIYNSEDFDADGDYNTGTGLYTPQIAGYYMISGNATFHDIGDGVKYIIALDKNGSNIAMDRGVAGGIALCGGCVSSIVYMNGTTDYVRIRVYHDHGSNRVLKVADGLQSFSGWLLPAP